MVGALGLYTDSAYLFPLLIVVPGIDATLFQNREKDIGILGFAYRPREVDAASILVFPDRITSKGRGKAGRQDKFDLT